MPQRRDQDLWCVNRNLELLESHCGDSVPDKSVSQACVRYQRDEIGIGRYPHGIGKSGHNNLHRPTESKLFQGSVYRAMELSNLRRNNVPAGSVSLRSDLAACKKRVRVSGDTDVFISKKKMRSDLWR